MKAYVITHPVLGIFYGVYLGIPLWTKIDNVNIKVVPTFESITDAIHATLKWKFGPDSDISFPIVEADCHNGTRASIASCIKAGLDGWLENLEIEGSC